MSAVYKIKASQSSKLYKYVGVLSCFEDNYLYFLVGPIFYLQHCGCMRRMDSNCYVLLSPQESVGLEIVCSHISLHIAAERLCLTAQTIC